jgi:hypothetical protein
LNLGFDALLPFPISPGTGEEHQKPGVGAAGRVRQLRSIGVSLNACVEKPSLSKKARGAGGGSG